VGDEEFLDVETSNPGIEDMLDNLEKAKEGVRDQPGDCAGNISYACVRESLNQLSDALEGREDYALIGGIPTQMEVLRRKGEDSPRVMNLFGNRYTSDLDILTTDPNEVRNQIDDSAYDESNLLDIDIIGPDLIDNSEDIIRDAETQTYSAYTEASTPLDAELRVPNDTDLLYTKIHDQASRQSNGTSSDAETVANSGIFDINIPRLYKLTNGNPEAQTYLDDTLAI
jgi:hypothetical protein